MGTNINTDFIDGMGRQGEKFLVILNIDKVLSHEGKDLRLCLDLNPTLASDPATEALEGAPVAA
jgi:chemotaxis signal transduction protein